MASEIRRNGHVSMMNRLKELEHENRQLKKMYAEAQLKAEVLKDALEKKL